MASQGRKSLAAPRNTQEKVYELGKQGRKTGVTLPESGVRDENGIESFKGIFDSPGKGSIATDSDDDDSEDDDAEASMDMDIAETPGPEPLTLLAKHTQSMRRPTAKAKSPALTSLQSPPVRAGQNSPLRRAPPAAIVNGHKSATMRLNFDARQHALPKPAGFGSGAMQSDDESGSDRGEEEEDADSNENEREMSQEEVNEFVEESLQMLDVGDDDDDLEESEPEPEPAPRIKPVAKQAGIQKKRGRPSKSADSTMELPHHTEDEENSRATEDPSPAVKKRGRPAKNKKSEESPAAGPPSGNSSAKRRREARSSNADSIPEEQEVQPEPASKRQRVAAAPAAAKGKPGRKPAASRSPRPAESSSTAAAKPKPKRGRPAKLSSGDAGDNGAGDESVLIVPRPPLPKRGGLVISRPGDSDGTIRTRSGRTSFRPLEHWRNERVEFEQVSLDARLGRSKNRNLLMPSIKEIVRVEEEEPPAARRLGSRRGAKKGGRGRRRADDSEDEDDEPSPWEQDPGELSVPVQLWQPEYELNPPGPDDEVFEDDDVVAVAGSAIRTRDILGSSFRFTKTLSLPFFGTGVVDLPPGAEKKAKNSRKMHMTFIVHTGRVTVSINDTSFSIGKGGMWFVPRGNYYSIANDGRKSSRIFFAQACEYTRPEEEEEEALD